MNIKNIIFDLGGVIIDLDFKRMMDAFCELGVKNVETVYTQNKQDSVFDDFETGKITAEVFRKRVKEKFDIEVTDEQFDKAWNALLGNLPRERLDFIKKLRTKYKVFLFSNTNEIHYKEVFNICMRLNGFNTFEGYFDREYYSFKFGQKKPNPEAFKMILTENGLNARETVHIDDTVRHVVGAWRAGLHAVYLSKEKSFFDIEKYIENMTNPYEEEQENKDIFENIPLTLIQNKTNLEQGSRLASVDKEIKENQKETIFSRCLSCFGKIKKKKTITENTDEENSMLIRVSQLR